MYSVTTFEWKHQHENLWIYFETGGAHHLVIKSMSVWIEDNRKGFLDVEFAFDNTGDPNAVLVDNEAYKFVVGVIKEIAPDFTFGTGTKYHLTFNPVSGEPLTETMMRKYLLLRKLCGACTVSAPRIVTESFVGNYHGHSSGAIPYGHHVMFKLLRGQDQMIQV